ncbi:DUF3857 domain-containing protein [Draconibacterium mangrovi]|uniref:DUF3857 domain-containing protein n=1 Tax=Draconibacterium mangrovi TaxID=2697469 RepID=UPI0013D4A7CB|nr:DUF3857 domain-containing protein [Draconibacterium mangrovi]
MRTSFFILFLLSFHFVFSQNQINKSATPTWVTPISFEDKDVNSENGGFQYLLLDYQDNFPEEASYKHIAIKLINSNGIQSNSDITVVFDPSYQKIYFHSLQIIRNGEVIDKLNLNNFQIIQRETSLDRSLYDGSLTALLNLTDVRENDIVEYSYTTKGFNPIYNGKVSGTVYYQYAIPVNHIYTRLLTDKHDHFDFKLYNDASNPEIKEHSGIREYVWNVNALDFKLYENNSPPWIDIHKKVSFTTIRNWEEVVNWALPLYTYPKESVKEIARSIPQKKDTKDAITSYIRFVQNKIRYLGFEDGINAFRPHTPEKVFNQRFGDCKDKSLLLVSLLRNIGVEAYPCLINSYLKDSVLSELPSINAFNHCIVNFNFEGKTYFVDPTISDQEGDLENLSVPDYTYGLLIKPNETKLTAIAPSTNPSIKVKEIITLDSINGNATFWVTTTYTGSKADATRSYFNSSSRESIKQDYTEFYRHLYPRIETANLVNIIEDDSAQNKVVVRESYTIKKIWEEGASGNTIYCDIYPIVLETYIDYANAANRKLPYYLGDPFTYEQTTEINMPETWNGDNMEITVDGNYMKYSNTTNCNGSKITVTHDYALLQSTVPGDSIETFLNHIEDIKSELHYYITYDPDRAKFKVSWISVLLVLLSVGLTTALSVFLYKRYNPNPQETDTNKAIGGWMVLPLIGLCLTPFVLIFQIFTEDYFNHNIWVGVYNAETALPSAFLYVLGGELIFNVFQLTFSIFLIVLFLKKRTSLPNLISFFYILLLVGAVGDFLALKFLLPGLYPQTDPGENFRQISRAFIGVAIWVPYFQISERVKETFTKTSKSKTQEISTVQNQTM